MPLVPHRILCRGQGPHIVPQAPERVLANEPALHSATLKCVENILNKTKFCFKVQMSWSNKVVLASYHHRQVRAWKIHEPLRGRHPKFGGMRRVRAWEVRHWAQRLQDLPNGALCEGAWAWARELH